MSITIDDEDPIFLGDNDDMASSEQDAETVDEEIEYGTEFEKVEDYDHFLGSPSHPAPNPWHPDLKKKLFSAQIIGFHWMSDRHFKGGAIIGDKVGCRKVYGLPDVLTHRLCRPFPFSYGSESTLLNSHH